MSYDKIKAHIRTKIIKVNVNNPKANWGARVLKESGIDLDLLDDYLYWAINTMQLHFNTNSPTNPSGRAGLTMISLAVGANVMGTESEKDKSKLQLIDEVRVGDLFLEPFIKFGFLTLVRPHTVDMMYLVEVTDAWHLLGKDVKVESDILKYLHHDPSELDKVQIKGEEHARSQDVPWCRSAVKLMQVPWRINKPVYEALRANRDMFVSDTPIDYIIDGEEDEYLKLQNLRRVSKNMDFNFVTKKAWAVMDKPFYMEVDADYRGRVYYKEPFLNFQGSDWARGIFEFHEGKPMTKDGEYWLAVHTAGSFNQNYSVDEIPTWCEADYKSYLEREGLDSISVDKFTLNDRVRWTNENMEVIIAAGHERAFGEDAEKPVAFLACCVEWYQYDLARRDGRMYLSHLPIPIDGSNNGWQHLGAISKDERTGELVGLVAKEIQRDFYVQTAKELLKIDDPILNSMPMKHVRKGISKRGSMTRAYSSGAATMAKNMWFDCRSEEYDTAYHIEEEDCTRWAKELIKAIDIVCPGPLKTMKYMQELAAFEIGTYKKFKDGQEKHSEFLSIRKELNEFFQVPVDERDDMQIENLKEQMKEYKSVLIKGNGSKVIRWTTPSDFPVRYECFKWDDFKCRGTINGKQIKHTIRVKTSTPDIRGFMSGISPNYIHSMDASHMALIIDDWKGAFGAIHDSFSTHACDVDNLLGTTKDKFVSMYDEDNLFNKIRNDITGGTDDVSQPDIGSLEIQEVYDSDYFFA